MNGDYVGMTLEERVKAAEAELKLYKAGLVGIPVTPAEPVEPKPTPTPAKPTVTIVNRSQQLRVAGMHPESEYSRVVSALAVVKSPDVRAIGYTSALGNNVRLKQIKCWFVPEWTSPTAWIDFMFRWGQGMPATYAEMSNWNDLMPINWLGSPTAGWRRNMFPNMLVWDMNRLFTQKALRFGIQLEVSPEVTYVEMYTSFQISEG